MSETIPTPTPTPTAKPLTAMEACTQIVTADALAGVGASADVNRQAGIDILVVATKVDDSLKPLVDAVGQAYVALSLAEPEPATLKASQDLTAAYDALGGVCVAAGASGWK